MDTTAPQTRTPNAIRTRRALDLSLNGVFWVAFLLVAFLAYGSVPNNYYQVLMVNSGSMSPTIEAGDLIVVTKPPEELRPGMVLTMVVNGGIVTHRLVDIDADGQLITRGDANEVTDQWESSDISVRGLYRFRIPRLGLLLNGPMQWLRGTVSGSWFTDAHEVTFTIGADWNTATPTPTVEPTEPPPGSGCTYSQGYWKTHPDAWPVDELIIGGVEKTKQQLHTLLWTPPAGGDATIILVHQYIAALLNIANGADPSAVAATLTAADVYLAQYPPGSNPSDRSGVELANTLDHYNNGLIGPGHCDGGNPQPEPTQTVPTVPPINPGCVYSQRHWMDHPDDWPLDAMTIGSDEKNKGDLLTLLETNPRGDKTIDLAQQYIVARLNIANGADPSDIEDILDAVGDFFDRYKPGDDPNDSGVKQECNALVKALDRYNAGKLTPPKCSGEQEPPEPASQFVELVTETPTPTATVTETDEVEATARGESAPEVTATPTVTPAATEDDGQVVEPSPEPIPTDTLEPTATVPPTETPLPPTDTPEPIPTDTPEPEPTESTEPVATEDTEHTEG